MFSFVVDTGIDAYPVQPGIKRCPGGKVFETSVCLDEHILCSLLCILSTVQHVNAKVKNPVLIFFYDSFEGCVRVLLE
jgi:hypothetical protein